MKCIRALAGVLGLGAAAVAVPAAAGQQVYVYSVLHPSYGRIGTLTDMVDRGSGTMRIESNLRIAVELVGIVVYRQEADITEIMNGGALASLDSVTVKGGERIEVHGRLEGGRFVVKGTTGSSTGPATTAPADPWVLKKAATGTLVYPSTGTIVDAQVSGGEPETISLGGEPIVVRHFVVTGFNREDVWLDGNGVPVMFRSVEDGTPIDFVLQRPGDAGADVAGASAATTFLASKSGDDNR